MKSASFVYFIQVIGGGPIKIGCSRDPYNRLVSMLAWSPYPLEIVATADGDYVTEGQLHHRFRRHRMQGEWFAPGDDLVQYMHEVKRSGVIECQLNEVACGGLGYRIRCRLFDIFAEKGVTVDQFAAVLGGTVARLIRWNDEKIPDGRIAAVLAAFSDLGHEVSASDLHEKGAQRHRDRLPEYRRGMPVRISDERLAECIANLPRCTPPIKADMVSILRAANGLIEAELRPRLSRISEETGIERRKCSRLIGYIRDAGILEKGGWNSYRFTERYEKHSGKQKKAA